MCACVCVSHGFHFDLLHFHLLFLQLLLITTLGGFLNYSGKRKVCIDVDNGTIREKISFLITHTHLQAALSLRILLIHDPLLLRSLLLFAARLSGLLSLIVSLLQEVLLHASTVPVCFLLPLNTQIKFHINPWLIQHVVRHIVRVHSPLCWGGASWPCRCCRSPSSSEAADCPYLWEMCYPSQAL